MAEPLQLRTQADLDRAVEASRARPVLVFKHSTACPVSARAHGEWQRFLASPAGGSVDAAWVRVIEERPVSLALAERVGVAHQSPQAILLRRGQAVWSATHGDVTSAALQRAVGSAG